MRMRLVAEIDARGKLPLLVGGTMLYFKALFDGLDDAAAPPIRQCARDSSAKPRATAGRRCTRGWRAIDPQTAARLAPNDAQRIQRALEVYRADRPADVRAARRRARTEAASPYRFVPIALEPSDRACCTQRIAARFDAMLAATASSTK